MAGGLASAGVPEALAGVLVRFDTDTAMGYLGVVSSSVATLTGKAPQDVESFLLAKRSALAA